MLADAGAIVEDAFADSLLHQELMVSVGEAVSFVADSLEQPQRTRIGWQHQRQGAARPVNFLVFFRQPDDRQFMQPKPLQFAAR